MSKFKVYCLDVFHPAGVEFISRHCDVVPYGDPRMAGWREDADGVMVRMRPVTADDFARAKKLKVVAKQGVGVNTLDLKAAKAHGVTVCNNPGVNSEAVANPNLAETWSVPIWAPFRAGPGRMLFASADVWDGAKKVATAAKTEVTVKSWQFIGTVRTGKSYAAVILIGETGKVQRAAEGDTLPNGEKIVAVGNGALQIDVSGTSQEIKLFDPEKKK